MKLAKMYPPPCWLCVHWVLLPTMDVPNARENGVCIKNYADSLTCHNSGQLLGIRWSIYLVLLRIPSSRPSPQTFPQFVRVQVLGFLAAENDGFET